MNLPKADWILVILVETVYNFSETIINLIINSFIKYFDAIEP